MHSIIISDREIHTIESSFSGTTLCGNVAIKPKSQRVKMQTIGQIQRSYSKEFTIHGLSRIFHGKRFERIFWFFWLAGMVSFAAYLGHSYYTRYASREFRLETRQRDINEIVMPTITVCEDIKRRICCFNNKSLCSSKEDMDLCTQPINLSVSTIKPCQAHNNYYSYRIQDCVIINYNGSCKQRMKDEYPIALTLHTYSRDLSFFMDDQEWTKNSKDVIFHSKLPPLFDGFYSQNVRVIVIKEKTRITRLLKPFLSNCSVGKGIENFFSKKYSQESCMQSCSMREMFDNCGAVIDRWQPFLTKKMKRKVQTSVNTTKCLSFYLNRFFTHTIPKRCNCPAACDEVEFENEYIRTDRRPSSFPTSSLHARELFVRFRSIEEVASKEIATYTFLDFLAEFGGIVGILVGMSVISVLELFVYFVLQVFKQFSS